MPEPTLAGPPPDDTLEPRLRTLLSELSAEQAAVLDDLWRERERLHSLAERHRLILGVTSDAILVTTVGGVVERASEAATALFGRPGSLQGTRLLDLAGELEREGMRGHIQRALAGETVRGVLALARPDGDRRRVAATLSPISEGGLVTGLVLTLRDFTDEARARDEVAAANARYRDLVESAADAIYTMDHRGMLTSMNGALVALIGRSREMLLGRSLLPLLEPSDQSRLAAQYEGVAAGRAGRIEVRFVRPDGEARLVSVSHTPIRISERATGILAVARDVTEERARAAALERAEASYTRLVESAEDVILTLDEEGCLTSVNRALERVTGRPRAELIGTHFADLLTEPERAPMWLLFTETLGGTRQRGEVRYSDAAGAPGRATIVSAPIVEGGRINGVLVILRDVTEERLLLEQVSRREKLAALGELVGGVAHEVNTPLTGILAFAQILLKHPDHPEARQAAETIAGEAKRAAKIVQNLLTFARQNPPERLPTDLNQVLQDTIELRRYPIRAQQIELDVSLDPAIPLTWADPFQLQQVFLNLLTNAEQALAVTTGRRCITVRTWRESGVLIVSIGDSGAGIAPEHLPHIFNPFYTTKPRGIGTGLGLSISDGIVREHDGTMRVISEPGQGASFEVHLPLVSPPRADPPAN